MSADKKKERKESELFYKVEDKFTIPMVFFTLLLLVIIIFEELFVLSPELTSILNFLDALIWVAFVVELLTMTVIAKYRLRYLLTHWYNVLIVFVPALRLTRLLNIYKIPEFARITRSIVGSISAAVETDSLIIRIVSLVAKGSSNIKDFLKENKFEYIAFMVALIVFLLGSLVAVLESKSPDSNISGIGDGVWWSVETITTVGYGDKYPVTTEGKLIGVILMAFGITAFSLLTASISRFLIGSRDERKDEEIIRRLKEIEARLPQTPGEVKKKR